MEKINPNDTKYNYLLKKNEKYMDYTALSFMGRKITYEEMHDRIWQYAKVLYKKGVRKGDIIGVCALNTPESVYLLYALDILGAVVVGFSPLVNKEQTERDIKLTKPKMIITVDALYGNFKDAEKALNISTMVYPLFESSDDKKLKLGYNVSQVLKGNYKLERDNNLVSLAKREYDVKIPNREYTPEEITDIMFTSGSSGIHKGVDLAGEGINYVVEGMNEIFKVEPGEIHLGNIPFGSMVFGRMILHYSLANNMEFALTLNAMPKDFYDELVRTHAHAAVGGPPHWVSLIEKDGDKFVPSSRLQKGSLPNFRFATSGGEALKENTIDAINDAFKYCGSVAKLGNGLGATETWATVLASNGQINTPGTLGRALSDIKVKLVDPETFVEVKRGEPGLILLSGPSIMKQYHNNPSETKKVMITDNEGREWLNLGDILMQNEKGEYVYVGRQKRNFVSGVENIYPEELEELISTIPEVREVVVTPISDEVRQFIPRYHISINDANLDTQEFERKLCDLVQTKLSENWLPGYIEYYTEPLKRNASSKIDIAYYKQKDQSDIENGLLKGKQKTLIK